jgi:hypothetical protein
VYILNGKRVRFMRPTSDQIKSASKDVAWEYAALLGAALEMACAPRLPLNHFVQESFLVHVRNLAEFFREGLEKFQKTKVRPDRPGTIYAVDFCDSVRWNPEPFDEGTKLIKVINQSLSHMTYGRDSTARGHVHFEGSEHVHGIVKLMRKTWEDFSKSVKPEFLRPQLQEDIIYWLVEHTKDWSVRFVDLGNAFEREARRWPGWKLDLTPDGPAT